MRKVSLLHLCLVLLLAITSCSYPNDAAVFDSDYWQESPRIYRLINDNAMSTMPTVTLYENGNVRLSQPPISSFYLSEFGHYEMDDETLTVTYGDDSLLTFSVTDCGNSLTLTTSNILFTTIGSLYQYQSITDSLEAHSKIDGPELTIETVRGLASQGHALTYSDFARYAHYDIDPDNHLFPVDGKYMLSIRTSAERDTSIIVENYSSGETFPLHLNGSTGLVFDEFLGLQTVPKYEARAWVDYYLDDKFPWDKSIELEIPEYPDVTFTWTSESVSANGVDLFWGMPVWNVYLSDLTNDGKPELCSTVSIGSGIVDTRIIIYDYANGSLYQLAYRMKYDYKLSIQNGKVIVTQSEYSNGNEIFSTELKLENCEVADFANYNPENMEGDELWPYGFESN